MRRAASRAVEFSSGREPLRAGWLASAPAVLLAGVAQALSFAPFELWWLQLIALTVLAHATAGSSLRRAALMGWLFALGWLIAGFWWLYISMHQFGGLSPLLAAAAVVLLAALLGLYYAAAMALWARWRTGRAGWDVCLWAACWLLAELARGVIFTGFPWIASGYAHTVGPLAAWAAWIGVYGLCALAALLASAAALWLRVLPMRSRALTTLAVAVLALAPHALSGEFTRSTGVLEVSLLQPNVAQDIKFDPARLESQIVGLTRQLAAARGTLVVTPESVVPLARSQLSEAYWEDLRAQLKPLPGLPDTPRAALVGIFLGDDESGYVNSVVGLPSDTFDARSAATLSAYRYGKRHLLPFGEIIPPGFHWFVALMGIPLADQERGQTTASLSFAGQRLRPLVCYEDLFGEEIASSMVGDQAATVFVNVSNLAWFGRLLVQDQHLQFSQMRALEFQRPVIRSTNTGATAVIDHHGQVTARLPMLTPGILEARVEGRIGQTPYASWLAAWGLWPLLVAALAMLGGAILLGRREGLAAHPRP
jgi:apolipoprotein N-acyltransferase